MYKDPIEYNTSVHSRGILLLSSTNNSHIQDRDYINILNNIKTFPNLFSILEKISLNQFPVHCCRQSQFQKGKKNKYEIEYFITTGTLSDLVTFVFFRSHIFVIQDQPRGELLAQLSNTTFKRNSPNCYRSQKLYI